MYIGLINGLHHVFIQRKRNFVTARHITFDEAIFPPLQGVFDEEGDVFGADQTEIISEYNENIR